MQTAVHKLPPTVTRERELRSTSRARKVAASTTLKSIDQAEVDKWIAEEWVKIFGEETALTAGGESVRRPVVRKRGCSVPPYRVPRLVHKGTQTEEETAANTEILEPISPEPLSPLAATEEGDERYLSQRQANDTHPGERTEVQLEPVSQNNATTIVSPNLPLSDLSEPSPSDNGNHVPIDMGESDDLAVSGSDRVIAVFDPSVTSANTQTHNVREPVSATHGTCRCVGSVRQRVQPHEHLIGPQNPPLATGEQRTDEVREREEPPRRRRRRRNRRYQKRPAYDHVDDHRNIPPLIRDQRLLDEACDRGPRAPVCYRAPSPVNHRPRSPVYHRAPSPVYRHRRSPVDHRGPSPMCHRAPSPVTHFPVHHHPIPQVLQDQRLPLNLTHPPVPNGHQWQAERRRFPPGSCRLGANHRSPSPLGRRTYPSEVHPQPINHLPTPSAFHRPNPIRHRPPSPSHQNQSRVRPQSPVNVQCPPPHVHPPPQHVQQVPRNPMITHPAASTGSHLFPLPTDASYVPAPPMWNPYTQVPPRFLLQHPGQPHPMWSHLGWGLPVGPHLQM
ncbi:pollen-specific leucine-rich repeat extensin-like protein 3 [Ischnura elegans]|uniref:pollen-specific leucine-rich repeat extensin-like protein 3 n=1 Tax=Ischnura elegans TaxID=197161 RepID=UPI001ED8A140|nr:pollen-specific leucine-rich repeat extensin-like protein 3 [Ischnura elegans]